MRSVFVAVFVGFAGAAFAQTAPKVVIGDNPSLSGAPLYIALEKGYYRAAGLDAQLEMSGTSSEMAVLARPTGSRSSAARSRPASSIRSARAFRSAC
jgi:ABC-type nitrate/sulfonate/bicarbonate transport system substrate-binding protein